MSLEKLSKLGWYRPEPTTPSEIADLFSIVERSLADLHVAAISDDLRFQAGYNAILTLANIALRASGFRVASGQGHHQRVIESLQYTLTTLDTMMREKWIRKIKAHAHKRNIATYDVAGGISQTDVTQIISDIFALRELVTASLAQMHPQLLLKDDSRHH